MSARGQEGPGGRILVTRSFCITQDLHFSFYLSGIQIDLGWRYGLVRQQLRDGSLSHGNE